MIEVNWKKPLAAFYQHKRRDSKLIRQDRVVKVLHIDGVDGPGGSDVLITLNGVAYIAERESGRYGTVRGPEGVIRNVYPERWVNLYKDHHKASFHSGEIHYSEEEAERAAQDYLDSYVMTVKLPENAA